MERQSNAVGNLFIFKNEVQAYLVSEQSYYCECCKHKGNNLEENLSSVTDCFLVFSFYASA